MVSHLGTLSYYLWFRRLPWGPFRTSKAPLVIILDSRGFPWGPFRVSKASHVPLVVSHLGTQGAFEGPKGSPREPSRARKGAQGSLRGPNGSLTEPSRVQESFFPRFTSKKGDVFDTKIRGKQTQFVHGILERRIHGNIENIR